MSFRHATYTVSVWFDNERYASLYSDSCETVDLLAHYQRNVIVTVGEFSPVHIRSQEDCASVEL